MKIADVPSRFNIPFADDAGGGYIRPIPEASQIGITNGAASLTDGFPPLNFLPVGAGGVPPFGQDMNGILNQVTLWNQWQAAGGLAPYSSAFSSAIGGYPKNAVLMGASDGNLWLNQVDDNTTDPDAGGANWIPIGGAATAAQVIAGLLNNVYVSPLGLTSVLPFRGVVFYTSSGVSSWSVPTSVKKALVIVTGGGGAGNRVTDGSGAGAGAGGTAIELVDLTGVTSVSVTVGAGGVIAGIDENGGTGGTSSFGAFCSATGGAGGTSDSQSGGVAGVGVGGDLNFQGSGGGGSVRSGTVLLRYGGGHGGSSFWGGGARGIAQASAFNGIAGTFGGGGSGGVLGGLGGTGGVGLVAIFY